MQITWHLCRLRYFSGVRTHIFLSLCIFPAFSRDDYNLATAANHWMLKQSSLRNDHSPEYLYIAQKSLPGRSFTALMNIAGAGFESKMNILHEY